MKKNISIGAGIAAVVVATIIIGWAAWFTLMTQNQAPKKNAPVSNQEPNSARGQTACPSQPTKEISKIDFSKIQFDGCGGKAKYKKMDWWNKFSAQVERYSYYSDSFVSATLKYASENDYRNPQKIKYTYETYCKDKNFRDSEICGEGKDRKLSINDSSFSEYGEGCLSKDETAFVVVFPGDYGGGGNYTFRYDISNNILEEAKKTNENQADGPWFSPPSAFGKRTGNIIKMSGINGDAGCSVQGQFDYNIVENKIKMTKRCTQCDEEKESCATFK